MDVGGPALGDPWAAHYSSWLTLLGNFYSPHTSFILPCLVCFVFSHVGRFPEWNHIVALCSVLMAHCGLWNQECWLCSDFCILLEFVPAILAGGNPMEAPANVVEHWQPLGEDQPERMFYGSWQNILAFSPSSCLHSNLPEKFPCQNSQQGLACWTGDKSPVVWLLGQLFSQGYFSLWKCKSPGVTSASCNSFLAETLNKQMVPVVAAVPVREKLLFFKHLDVWQSEILKFFVSWLVWSLFLYVFSAYFSFFSFRLVNFYSLCCKEYLAGLWNT